MSEQTIRLLISWLPSILFILAIIGGLVLGIIRGFRKSLILTLQALIIAVVCIVGYISTVNTPSLDSLMYSGINSGLNRVGESFQSILGVSDTCESITDVLIEFIPKNMQYGDGISLVLKDNGAYLATLVDMVYHLIFAIVFCIFYYILDFIMYLIYLIFYPERRYKRKIKQKYREVSTSKPYRKRPILGGIVGGLRSMVVSLVGLSFFGSFLFVIAGGIGDKSYNESIDYNFEDESVNVVYDIYKAIGSYGTTGIYKVLNTIKDSNDLPFYLYAADLVFQGGLEDTNRGINQNIYFSKELAIYTSFARDTFDLLLKYDEDGKIKDVIKGTSSEDMMDTVIGIMALEGFQDEFNLLIDSFESDTYFMNFSISLIDSIIVNIDKLTEGLDQQTVDMLNIIFSKEEGITLSHILTQEDAKILVKACVGMLIEESKYNEEMTDLKKVCIYGKVLIPEIAKLSILSDESRKNELNPVLENLYDYFAIALIEEENKDVSNEVMKLSNTTSEEVDWVNEIVYLLDASLAMLNLVDRVYNSDEVSDSNSEIIDILLDNIFFGDNAKENEADYDIIVEKLSASKFLGIVLSMDKITSIIEQSLSSMIPNFEFLPEVQYANVYNDDGSIKEYGEIYNLLTTLKLLIKNDAKDIFTSLTDTTGDTKAMLDSVDKIVDILKKEVDGENNETIMDNLFKSELLTYTLSNLMMNMNFGEEEYMQIYVPQDCTYVIRTKETETEIKEYLAIDIDELKTLINELPDLISILRPMFEDEGKIKLSLILNDDKLPEVMASSKILEGTVSSIALGMLKDQEMIVIPESLNSVDAWLSTSNDKGEIIKIIDAIQYSNIDLDEIMSSTDTNAILDIVLELNQDADSLIETSETRLDYLFESLVLKATLSKELDNALVDFIDEDILNSTSIKDSIDTINPTNNTVIKEVYYKKSEVASIIDSLNELEISSLDENALNIDAIKDKVMNLNDISILDSNQTKLNILYKSSIIRYSLASALDESLTTDIVSLEVRDSELVKIYEDITNINTNSIVFKSFYKEEEISSIINSLNELEISSLDENAFDTENLKDKILNLNDTSLTDENLTKLDVLYSSVILKNAMTNPLDTVLTDESLAVSDFVLASVKTTENQESIAISYYLQSELSKLINALSENGLAIDSIDSLANYYFPDEIKGLNEIPNGQSQTRLNVVYASNIIKDILSSKISKSLDDNTNIVNDPEAKYEFIEQSGIYFYYEEELKLIIDFVDSLGDTASVDTLDISSITIDEDLKNNILKSKILYATASKFIIDNQSLIKPEKCITITENQISKISSEEEMSNLIDVIIALSGGSISGEIDLTLSEETIEIISNSIITRATISDKIIDNATIVIPNLTVVIDELYTDVNVLTQTETNNLLYAIYNGLGITDVDGLDIEDNLIIPEEDSQIEALVNSYIMKATITKNIKVTDDSLDLFVENQSEYVEKISDINNQDILVLSKEEIKNIITAIKKINNGTSFEIEISFEKLLLLVSNIENTYQALESSVIRMVISNYLLSNEISIDSYSIGYESEVTSIHIGMNSMINEQGQIEIEGHTTYELINQTTHYTFGSSEATVYELTTIDMKENIKILTANDIVAYLLYIKGFSS